MRRLFFLFSMFFYLGVNGQSFDDFTNKFLTEVNSVEQFNEIDFKNYRSPKTAYLDKVYLKYISKELYPIHGGVFPLAIYKTKDYFLALTLVPCGAGGLCESSELITYNHQGVEMSKIDFHWEFGDDGFLREGNSLFANDSILECIEHEATYEEEIEIEEDGIEVIVGRKTVTEFYDHKYYILDNRGKFSPIPNLNKRRNRKFPETASRIFHVKELTTISNSDLSIMRNEIFADYGYKFKTSKWKDYFSQFDWYSGTKDDVLGLLNPIEKVNIQNILKIEKR